MNIEDAPNPYEFANPITQLERFAGRQSELNDIRYYLRQARNIKQPINLALVGERAAGKTSLLNIIEHDANKLGLLTVRINLNSADQDPMLLFWKMYEAIIDSAMDSGYLFPPGSDEDRVYRRIIDGLDLDADTPDFPLRFPAHYAASANGGRQISETKLSRDLKTVYKSTNTPLILLFDECNVLAQNRVTLEMLRNIFMNMPGYLLVLTGTPAMFPLFDEVFSPIIRQFKKVPVEAFKDHKETEECITGPLTDSGLNPQDIIDFSFILSRDVHKLAGGRPYEIQLLCHIMFRRMQDGRAEKMALTADVIDDVLQELDTSAPNSGSSRPLLQAVQSLNDHELSALDTLTRCNGNATLDELWFMNQLGAHDKHMNRKDLSSHLEGLISREILAINQTEKIIFKGDEFERIYLSYFAKSRDLAVRIFDWTYPARLSITLSEIIESSWHVSSPTSEDGRPYIEETLRALLSCDRKRVRDATDTVHPWIINAIPYGTLDIYRVTLTYGPHRVLAWTPASDSTTMEAISPSIEKITALGGELIIDKLAFPVPSKDEYITRLLNQGNQRILLDLGQHHADEARIAYTAGDYAKAWDEIDLALHFSLEDEAANNIGYMHLAAGKFSTALDIFDRALSTASMDHDTDIDTESLILYNRAISRLGCLQLNEAKKGLTEALDRLNSGSSKKYEVICLFIPSITRDTLILSEQEDPELGAAIRKSIEVLSSVDEEMSCIQIEPFPWHPTGEDE